MWSNIAADVASVGVTCLGDSYSVTGLSIEGNSTASAFTFSSDNGTISNANINSCVAIFGTGNPSSTFTLNDISIDGLPLISKLNNVEYISVNRPLYSDFTSGTSVGVCEITLDTEDESFMVELEISTMLQTAHAVNKSIVRFAGFKDGVGINLTTPVVIPAV
jgi:hypothetical protein